MSRITKRICTNTRVSILVNIYFARYVKTLSFKTDPDYNFICNKFKKAAEGLSLELDEVFDWTDTTQLKKI